MCGLGQRGSSLHVVTAGRTTRGVRAHGYTLWPGYVIVARRMCDRLILRSIQMIDAGVADAIARGFVVHIVVDARLVLQQEEETVRESCRFRVRVGPPTAMLPLLRLFGRGT